MFKNTEGSPTIDRKQELGHIFFFHANKLLIILKVLSCGSSFGVNIKTSISFVDKNIGTRNK